MSSVDPATSEDALNFESKKKKKVKPLAEPNATENVETLDPLNFGTKKKKKSKPVELNETEAPKDESKSAALGDATDKKKKVVISDGNVDELTDKLDEELSFDFKKKKRKPKVVDIAALDADNKEATSDVHAKENIESPVFTYDMLLTRVFTQMGVQNPELVSDQKRRLTMVPPQMARVGTKKTLFINFATICNQLNRDPTHLTTYILAELGTQGSVDANGALLIRGRYQNKHMEPVLRNYCRNYVLCGTCQSSETDLCKDSRLLFLHCRRCGSRITVKTVTSGFQAVTGRRAAIRARNQ